MAMPHLVKYAKLCMSDVGRLCRASGIDRPTYYGWKKQAEELMEHVYNYEDKTNGKGEYIFDNQEKYLAIFFEEVLMVVARCEMTELAKVVESEDWRSGAWLLERTNPNQFAKRRDIANVDEFLRFVQKYFGEASAEALQYVWDAIMQSHEERMTYDEAEAVVVNTRNESPRAISDESSSE